jgi:hypothetical protein
VNIFQLKLRSEEFDDDNNNNNNNNNNVTLAQATKAQRRNRGIALLFL